MHNLPLEPHVLGDHALHELMHLNLAILEQLHILYHLIYYLDPLIHTGQPNHVGSIQFGTFRMSHFDPPHPARRDVATERRIETEQRRA